MLLTISKLILFIILLFIATLSANAAHHLVQPKPVSTVYTIQYPNQVNKLLNEINPQKMWADFTILTSFPDRGADHDSGVAAANWIKTEVETIAKNYSRNDVSVYFIETGNVPGYPYIKQPSVVAKIGTSTEPGIVLGAHLDTVECENEGCEGGKYLQGADDDGSGAVTILETARVLIASNLYFQKPIYLIWYAAEEWGDVGSQLVVEEFQKQNIPVKAVIQFDQTGYAYHNDPTMWLFNDENLDPKLTYYLKTLIKTYIKQPVKFTQGGSSDEESWLAAGYTVVRPAEADYTHDKMNPYTHSSTDTMDKLSLSHMTDYLKLAIAFSVELAEPAGNHCGIV